MTKGWESSTGHIWWIYTKFVFYISSNAIDKIQPILSTECTLCLMTCQDMLEIMHKSKKMKNNYHKYPFDIYQENKWKKKLQVFNL